MSVPPTPPLKSSQRTSGPVRPVTTVRAVEEFAEPALTARPSMRRSLRSHAPNEDPRRLVQGAVRQAASDTVDERIIDRGRPRVDIPRRQDSTRSPPGTRTPVEINWEDGFSYIDQEEASELPGTPAPLRPSASKRPAVTNVSPSFRSRAGSFESGKPRGLSFHEARDFMRSGRGRRPGSWHEAPMRASSAHTSDHGTQGSTLPPSRSRSPQQLRSRSPSPSTRARIIADDDDGFTEVSMDGTILRPLHSHPPMPEDHLVTPIVDDLKPHPPLPSLPPEHDTPPPPEKSSSTTAQSSPPPWQVSLRSHLGAGLGEFLGTTSFLFMAFGGVVAATSNTPDPVDTQGVVDLAGFGVSRLLYISLAFGFAYMVSVWTFFHVSDGLFNPAVSNSVTADVFMYLETDNNKVTLALFITGTHGVIRSLLLLFAQLSGSIAASALTLGVFQTILPARTSLAAGVSLPRGLFIEAILTAQLVLVILLFARQKHRATIATPVIVGLALFASELVAIFWTGGSLNPARSFGPNVVSWAWGSTHWIYWAGPLLGSVIAVVILRVLQALPAEMRSEDERYNVHLSPPCLAQPVFERGNYMGMHGVKGLGIESPYGDDSHRGESELTGVINLWQTRPGVGRFRGNSLAHGSHAAQFRPEAIDA